MNNLKIWNIAGIGVIAVILLLTVFLGIVPTVQDAQTLDAQRATDQEGNVARSALLESYAAASLHKDTVASELFTLGKGVPPSLNLTEFLDEVRSLSSGAGIAVTNLSVAKPLEYVAPATLTNDPKFASDLGLITPNSTFISNVTMTLAGTLEQINSFVAGLRTGDRVCLVYSFVIPDNVPDASGAVTVDIAAQIFLHSQ